RTTTNLWTGLAVCGEPSSASPTGLCGSPLHHVSKGRRRKTQASMTYLVCARARNGKGCSLPYVDARAFEMLTVGALAKHLDWDRVSSVNAKATRTAVEVAEERAAVLSGQVQNVEERSGRILAAIESGDAPQSLVARL